MIKIGLLSDTHGFFHPRLPEIFKDCDQIWHAGDIGSMEVIEKLKAIKPLVAVYGNIDGQPARSLFKQNEVFEVEGLKVFMTHIGGHPGKYEAAALDQIRIHQPGLMVCGHSHILKVIFDKKQHLLHINPGAGGKSGFHKVITFVKLEIHEGKVTDVEVVEYPKSDNPAHISDMAMN